MLATAPVLDEVLLSESGLQASDRTTTYIGQAVYGDRSYPLNIRVRQGDRAYTRAHNRATLWARQQGLPAWAAIDLRDSTLPF